MREKDKYYITVNDIQIEKNEFEFDKDKEGNVLIDIFLKSLFGDLLDVVLLFYELELFVKYKEIVKSVGSFI